MHIFSIDYYLSCSLSLTNVGSQGKLLQSVLRLIDIDKKVDLCPINL